MCFVFYSVFTLLQLLYKLFGILLCAWIFDISCGQDPLPCSHCIRGNKGQLNNGAERNLYEEAKDVFIRCYIYTSMYVSHTARTHLMLIDARWPSVRYTWCIDAIALIRTIFFPQVECYSPSPVVVNAPASCCVVSPTHFQQLHPTQGQMEKMHKRE